MPSPAEPIPLFLRECDKKTPPHHCTCCDNHANYHHDMRSFELVVSLETLLVTEDAGERLFEFARQSIIWLSDHIYMTGAWGWCRKMEIFGLLINCPRNHVFNVGPNLRIYIMPSSNASEEPGRPTPVLSVTDTLLRLCANHKNSRSIRLERHSDFDPAEPFPVLPSTLKAFVSEAQSPRELCFDDAGLSIEQWRVVAFNCNPNVKLCDVDEKFYKDWHSFRMFKRFKITALSEAMNLNQGPTKMELYFLDKKFPEDIFHGFCGALALATSLKNLHVHIESKEWLMSFLCTGLARNRGLETLNLFFGHGRIINLSNAEWELLCSVLGSHPTLRSVTLSQFMLAKSSCSPESDDIWIQNISKNKVLCKLRYYEYFYCFENFKRVNEAIDPVLELNRFRSVVQGIKYESDQTRRQKRFTTTLLCTKVCHRPPRYCFLLLKENSDLLAELSSLQPWLEKKRRRS